MENLKKIFNYYKVISLVILVMLCGLLTLYMNPQILMTDTAKTLTDEKLVAAENAVRGNVLSVGGAIFVFASLWLSILQTNIALNQAELERQKAQDEKDKEWKNKVEEAYIKWAEAFLTQTKSGVHRIRYREDKRKQEESQKEHSNQDFLREKFTLRILSCEKRQLVHDTFKEINTYPYPHYPIIKKIKDKAKRKEVEKRFWEIADYNEKIAGHFYGVTKKRLTAFCDWMSNPDAPLEIPNFNSYLKFVKETIPDLTEVIDSIID